jgi:hypothetical protein
VSPRTTTACFALALACSPAQTRVADPAWTADTGSLPDADTGALPAERAPDLATWRGVRSFRIDTDWDDYDCEDEVEESGAAPADPQRAAELREACPECTHFYEVALSTDMICGYLPLDPSPWRGLVLGDTTARVLRLHGGRGESMWIEELDPAARFDGWSIAYSYVVADGWLEAIEVEGRVDFPDIEAQR